MAGYGIGRGGGRPDDHPVDLPMPQVGWPAAPAAGSSAKPEVARFVLDDDPPLSLWLFEVGLACCAVEFVASTMAADDFARLGVRPYGEVGSDVVSPPADRAEVMVVSGTVTDKMAPAIRRLYDDLSGPKYVISFGSCANSGGPYWDSYCVTKGVDQLVPVDVYVPGCPPRPEALLHGLVRLREKIAAGAAS